MELFHWRLMVDFGLVVLIWIVQLIIYPGFEKYSSQDLLKWHNQYTKRIGIIVMPLMLSQMGLAIFQILYEPSVNLYLSGLAVLAVWLITFLYFVPAHNKISRGETDKILPDLSRVNWWRTMLWSIVFLLDLAPIIQN